MRFRLIPHRRKLYLFVPFSDLNISVSFFTRFSPSRNTIIHTPEPVAAFMMRIPDSLIPSKETSIDLCKEKIETKAVAKEIFRSVTAFAERIWRDFTSFTVASVIFVNAYTAMEIITISWKTVPLSRTTASTTVPASGTDSTISMIPANLVINRPFRFVIMTANRAVLKIT